MPVKHNFHSDRDDSNDGGLVQPSAWNEDHVLDPMLATIDNIAPLPNRVLATNGDSEAYLKPISDFAPTDSAALTGAPTAPTPPFGNASTRIATMEALDTAIRALIGTAPGALDTLAELAAALGNNANFATAVTLALTYRLQVDAAQGLTSGQQLQGRNNLGLATVAATGAYSDLTGTPALGTAAALNYGTAAGNLVRLDPATAKLPAVDGSQLTNLPTTSGVTSYNGRTNAVTAAGTDVPLRSYLAGLDMQVAGDGQSSFGINAGVATDSTNAVMMSLAAAYTKTTSAWAVGTGNGGLDTGAIAASTWYHVHLIRRPDTGVVDVLVSLSATAPTLPANYTQFRRVGSLFTDASSKWTRMYQNGDEVIWGISRSNLNAVPGDTVAHTLVVSVPTGVYTTATLAIGAIAGTGADGRAYLSELDKSDQAAASDTLNAGNQGAASLQTFQRFAIRANTSGAIRYRMASTTGQLIVNTQGYIDRRGRDA